MRLTVHSLRDGAGRARMSTVRLSGLTSADRMQLQKPAVLFLVPRRRFIRLIATLLPHANVQD
jgi:DNA helicase IV